MNKYDNILTKDVLEDLYIKQNKNSQEIAILLGIKSRGTVYKALKNFGIEIRKRKFYPILTKEYLAQCVKDKRNAKDISNEVGCNRNHVNKLMRQFEVRPYRKNKQLNFSKKELEDLYLKQKISIKDMCKILKTSNGTIKRHFLEYGIKFRSAKSISLKKKAFINRNSKGFKEINGNYWGYLKKQANKRNKKFEITIIYIWNLFLKQNRKCAISGLKLRMKRRRGLKHDLKQTASLDRIDSSKGYIEGNVQWVHKRVNMMKGQLKDDSLVEFCEIITDYQRSLYTSNIFEKF